jgi:hypothetical protein
MSGLEATHAARPPRSPWVIAGAVAMVWVVAVAVALLVTLRSLHRDDFDGLNNLFQIPFAMPWFLVPLPRLFGSSHETDAWVTAAMGWMNGVILYALLRRYLQTRRVSQR